MPKVWIGLVEIACSLVRRALQVFYQKTTCVSTSRNKMKLKCGDCFAPLGKHKITGFLFVSIRSSFTLSKSLKYQFRSFVDCLEFHAEIQASYDRHQTWNPPLRSLGVQLP